MIRGLFGQSFSVALLIQALRRRPCLGSFSVVWSQAHRGAPWLGSYSVVQDVGRLVAQPLCCSAASGGVWGERGCGHGSTATCESAVSPCFMAAWLSSTGISRCSLLPHTPSIRLSSVKSSACLGIAPQSLNSSSQLLHLPGDLCPCPGCE